MAGRLDTANAGWLRPPVLFLVSILIGVALEQIRPLPILWSGLSAVPGIVLIVMAAAVFYASVRTFQGAGTPVPGNEPTTAIVRSGPYRFSRNPIYVAFCLAQVGTGALLNSAWVIATLPIAVALLAWRVIPREERYLEARFGAQYLEYKKSVRRWL
jgi:protein-S-isoprenylcysteine O-methyltransferase Ste14